MPKICFLDLLKTKSNIIIPIIQRDYAQGRDKGALKELCEEVREDFVSNLYEALINDEEIILDYVYGSDDEKIFYPIDGQQRLTTIYLLHWYIGKKEKLDVKGSEFVLLRKFSYEIRDASKEFCISLPDINIDFSLEGKISDQIKNDARYHNVFNSDPTIMSMLVMIDKIDDTFRNVDVKLWKRLNKITFWELDLKNFGFTDDLFVKMNARGKRLSRFDTFKSDLESKFSKKPSSYFDTWKIEIDNTYLDKYWSEFKKEKAEINLFRTIIFYFKSLITSLNSDNQLDNEWEDDSSKVKYYDVIDYIKNDENNLKSICNILDRFEKWKSYVVDFGLFVKQNESEQKMKFYNEVLAFGILHWFSKDNHNNIDENYKQFLRILYNYIYSIRQADYTPRRQYSSSIDNKRIAKDFDFIKNLIDSYDDLTDFNSYIINTRRSELSFEIEKLEAVANHQATLDEIKDLEDLPCLRRNIHNFFFNGMVQLRASYINDIFSNDILTNKSLRIIYSYANDEYGKFNKLLFDPISKQSGRRYLYYNDENDQATGYFHIYSFRNDEFGDRVLTSKGNDRIDQYYEMSKCVKNFVNDLKALINNNTNISEAIDILFNSRIRTEDYGDPQNIKWYIVKYDAFFKTSNNTTISTLRRKEYGGIDIENVYDIQCIDDDSNDFNSEHYHPFYLALSKLLENRHSTITIDPAILMYVGNQIEYAHPCILSNDWIIRILDNGDWKIDFKNGVLPSQSILSQYGLTVDDNKTTLVHNGTDCIERMADFILLCN